MRLSDGILYVNDKWEGIIPIPIDQVLLIETKRGCGTTIHLSDMKTWASDPDVLSKVEKVLSKSENFISVKRSSVLGEGIFFNIDFFDIEKTFPIESKGVFYDAYEYRYNLESHAKNIFIKNLNDVEGLSNQLGTLLRTWESKIYSGIFKYLRKLWDKANRKYNGMIRLKESCVDIETYFKDVNIITQDRPGDLVGEHCRIECLSPQILKYIEEKFPVKVNYLSQKVYVKPESISVPEFYFREEYDYGRWELKRKDQTLYSTTFPIAENIYKEIQLKYPDQVIKDCVQIEKFFYLKDCLGINLYDKSNDGKFKVGILFRNEHNRSSKFFCSEAFLTEMVKRGYIKMQKNGAKNSVKNSFLHPGESWLLNPEGINRDQLNVEFNGESGSFYYLAHKTDIMKMKIDKDGRDQLVKMLENRRQR